MIGRPIIPTLVTLLMAQITVGEILTRKIRAGERTSLQCPIESQDSYSWTRNGVAVVETTIGIDSTSIDKRRLIITRMSQDLVGIYRCFLNGGQNPVGTIQLYIVELAEYAICKQQQCPVDYNYDSYSQFTLDATIVFDSGAECCNENLTDSIWMIKEIPSNDLIGKISGNNSELITPPGIDISVETSNDLTTNIARVNITSANSRFQIVHEIHPDIDGENGRMIAVTFNFNYTQVTVGEILTRKIRAGERTSLQCPAESQDSYSWTRNGVAVVETTIGIDSTSIDKRRLIITRMSQDLVGIYRCFLNRGQNSVGTIQLYIVELAEYAICKQQQCPVDYNYDSYSRFTLNATIVFNSGAECCNENLSDSIWMIKEIPSNDLIGKISGNNSELITPPGIDISVETSNDLTTNIARVNITSANSRFRIVHEIHPDIDGENGRMIAVTFNFNYTQVSPPTTTPIASTTIIVASRPPPSTISESIPSLMMSTGNFTQPNAASSTTQPSNSTPGETTITTPPSNDTVISKDKGGINTGVIIGVVIGIIAVILIIGIIFVVVIISLYRRNNSDAEYEFSPQKSSSASNGSRPGQRPLRCTERKPLTDEDTCTTDSVLTPFSLAAPFGNHNQQEGEGEPVDEGDLGENPDDNNI